jgi:hypothetical protein
MVGHIQYIIFVITNMITRFEFLSRFISRCHFNFGLTGLLVDSDFDEIHIIKSQIMQLAT